MKWITRTSFIFHILLKESKGQEEKYGKLLLFHVYIYIYKYIYHKIFLKTISRILFNIEYYPT